jgi:prolyl-tRNA synthetase
VLALVRGDDRLEENKLAAALGIPARPATEEEILAAFGASGGSLGPVGFSGEIVADEALRQGQFVSGANRDDRHLRGVEAGRDFQPRFADLRQSNEGDTCPVCGGSLRFQSAIELGHIFKLGTCYSEPLHAFYLDESGKEQPIVMGSYGIGPGRVLAAAIEQNHDAGKIVWPRSIAPYEVEVIALRAAGEGILATAEEIAEKLSGLGHETLLDDREERPGEKFADADLIGAPLRVTIGKKTLEDGAVDLKAITSGEERRLAASEVAAAAAELLA